MLKLLKCGRWECLNDHVSSPTHEAQAQLQPEQFFPTLVNAPREWACLSLLQHGGQEVWLKTLLRELIERCAVALTMFPEHAARAEPLRRCSFSQFLGFILLCSVNLLGCCSERISPERCFVVGPGLNPDIVLPVRYFIIQAVDSNGENLTLSPGKVTNAGTW